MTDKIRFIVIGSGRCGTGLLRSSINSHPDVTCSGEILNPSDSELRKRLHKKFVNHENGIELIQNSKLTRKDAIKYLDTKFWLSTGSVSALGFKLLYSQADNLRLWRYLKKNQSTIPLIHITRNPIATYVSLQQALKKKEWVLRVGEEKKIEEPINIHIPSFIKYLNRIKRYQKKVRKVSQKIWEISYADLAQNYYESMERVFRFLNVKPQPPSTELQKQQNWSIQKRIANFSDFEKGLPGKYKIYLEGMI